MSEEARKARRPRRQTVTVRTPAGEVYVARVVKVSHELCVGPSREPVFEVDPGDGVHRYARVSWIDEGAKLVEVERGEGDE